MSARAQVLRRVPQRGPRIQHARGRARSLEEVFRGRRTHPGHRAEARGRTQGEMDGQLANCRFDIM